jgi:alkanesulfonate monooxygenase SsuD/methylene tetrahydromethanopterin reductase-like flavin-dependent oxidoreductase (luciferase family)
MRFQVLDIAFNPPHPVTGEQVPPADRLNRMADTAVLAEELGFDSFAVGERHAGPVLSSAPTGLFLADTTEEAVEQYRPIYKGQVRQQDARKHAPGAIGKVTSFRTLEKAVERGPALVGSTERVVEKILDYHSSFGHVLQAVSVNHLLAPAHQEDVLRRFAAEVIPQVRAEVRTDLWGPLDERRAAGFTAADTREPRTTTTRAEVTV